LNEQLIVDTNSYGKIAITIPKETRAFALTISPLISGFWTTARTVSNCHGDETINIDCPPLPKMHSTWWREVMNIPEKSRLGNGMKIGVVDTPFGEGGLWQTVKQTSLKSGVELETDPLAHGAQVCSVLAANSSERDCYSGIARGAKIIHASSVNVRGAMSSGIVASAIRSLCKNHLVDIINLSFGTNEKNVAVHNALKDAYEAGVIVMAAAGNSSLIAYPAAHPECMAIGAVGRRQFAPAATIANFEEMASSSNIGGLRNDLFVCNFSGVGASLFAVAPGCGLIFDVNDQGLYDLIGTSFSCPLAAGILAAALSKDREFLNMTRNRYRVDYARNILANLCSDLGLPNSKQGNGLPILPTFTDAYH
jgi:subtilisin family serine protease